GVITAVSYDDRGLPADTSYANGTHEVAHYDGLMRLADQTLQGPEAPLQALAYTRDHVGNILTIDDQTPDSPIKLGASYGYDACYRLTSAQLDKETLSYQYDAIDNILSATSSLGAASPQNLGGYQYDPARPNAVVQAGAMNLAYDAAGHVTQRGQMTLSWD